ncbi:MAG TPA: DUF2892 domain-containing protein [Edaphocola sp.]|nr:DUF2892 domain-containing protein [Edaphocola sp.]
MKKNIGHTDKLTRIVVASFFVFLIIFKVVSGVTAIVFGVLALILAITSFINFCPIYHLLGIKTRRRRRRRR